MYNMILLIPANLKYFQNRQYMLKKKEDFIFENLELSKQYSIEKIHEGTIFRFFFLLSLSRTTYILLSSYKLRKHVDRPIDDRT